MTRRVIDRITLMNKLDNMPSKEVSELQMHHIFTSLGYNIEIEEESGADEVQVNSEQPE